MTTEAGQVLGGVDPVVEAVAVRLETTIVDELARLETIYGRPVPAPTAGESDLWRPPGLIARNDRAILEPDDYPALLVVMQYTEPAVVVDVENGAAVYQIPYRVRVWGACRHFGADEVVACRNRLALGTLQALLRRPRLADGMSVDLGGWRQSFSDVGVDADKSTVAEWWLELVIRATETVTLDTVAVAATIGLAVHPEADD